MPRFGASTASLDPDFDLLSWDSQRFGFPVARLHSSVSTDALEGPVNRLRKAGVVLAYYSLDEQLAPIGPIDAARLGANLVDTRVTYVSHLSATHAEEARHSPESHSAPVPAERFVIRSFRGETVRPELIALARESGRYSRFRVDPRIDTKVFLAIYDAWLERSVRREIADEVFVASDAGHDVGLVTVSAAGQGATIGLLSVSDSVRGQGLGRLLTHYAFDWAAARACAEGRVVTQLANGAACRMYEAAGCRVERRQRTYHFWLD